jgi:hypothetical protein
MQQDVSPYTPPSAELLSGGEPDRARPTISSWYGVAPALLYVSAGLVTAAFLPSLPSRHQWLAFALGLADGTLAYVAGKAWLWCRVGLRINNRSARLGEAVAVVGKAVLVPASVSASVALIAYAISRAMDYSVNPMILGLPFRICRIWAWVALVRAVQSRYGLSQAETRVMWLLLICTTLIPEYPLHMLVRFVGGRAS